MKTAEGDTPVTQHLRELRGRMQASQERHDETLAQRKTFEQIAKRLRDERLGLQTQVRRAGRPAPRRASNRSLASLTPRTTRSCARWSATLLPARKIWRS